MFTVSVEFGQVPFDVVHTKVLMPVVNVVTVELFKVGFVTEEPPAITDHIPVPIEGIFEFNVDVDAQIVKSVPALAVVG